MITENANAFRLAIFTATIYVAALTVGVRLLYYLAYVLGAVLIVALFWAQLNRRGLRVNRKVEPEQVQVGQTVQETVELTNLAPLRKLWLEVRDHSTLPGHQVGAVVSLPARGVKRWRVRTLCLKRGLYRLGPTMVQTGDPFGLFGTTRLFSGGSELLVLPPTLPLQSFGLPPTDLPGGNQTRGRAFHSTPNAVGIREYMPGDPMNRIHWSVTAKSQKLMVKEFELDPTTDLWLIVDLEQKAHVPFNPERHPLMGQREQTSRGAARTSARSHLGVPDTAQGATGQRIRLDPSTEEYSVVVAASLAAYFVGQGRSVGLIAWGQHAVTLPADRGGRQLMKILRALAVLRAEGTASLAAILNAQSHHFARQDTIVVVTPSLDEQWVRSVQLQTQKGTKATAVIVEPGTFGGEGNLLLVVGALTGSNVPTYLVKCDDQIDGALSQEYIGTAVRNMR